MGIFGKLFDFDKDGRLDAIEQSAELGFVAHILANTEF